MESFPDFDIKKCIVNLLEDEYSFKDLVDMLSFFVSQVTKKMIVYFLQKIIYFSFFFEFHIVINFCKYVLGFINFLHHLKP
jgi:hypothetical protein